MNLISTARYDIEKARFILDARKEALRAAALHTDVDATPEQVIQAAQQYEDYLLRHGAY